jgi:hypothetical protein
MRRSLGNVARRDAARTIAADMIRLASGAAGRGKAAV